jgi:hypothetical protein
VRCRVVARYTGITVREAERSRYANRCLGARIHRQSSEDVTYTRDSHGATMPGWWAWRSPLLTNRLNARHRLQAPWPALARPCVHACP